MMKLFTSWEPDPAGLLLGTGFMRFTTKLGIDGLALESNDHIDILAVHSDDPGKGNFRKFLIELRARYHSINFLSVQNDILRDSLVRGYFKPTQFIGTDGVIVAAMGWKKEMRPA